MCLICCNWWGIYQWMWLYCINTNLSWMLHHVQPLDCFLMHTVIMLNYDVFFSVLCLWLAVWASKWLLIGGGFVCMFVCVCVLFAILYTGFHWYFLFFFVTQTSSWCIKEANISVVILLNEESVMEPFVVYLLISFKETLSSYLHLWQRSLCVILEMC